MSTLNGYSSPSSKITIALKSESFNSDSSDNKTINNIYFYKNISAPQDNNYNNGNYTVYYTPEHANIDSLTAFSPNGFINNSDLLYIYIQNINTIEPGVFASCAELISIVLGSSLSNIGESAFQGCSSLSNITILSTSTTSIGTDAFQGLSSTITISGNIPDNLFTGVTNISSVTIGNNVTSIGISAFQGCSQLTSIIIPNNVATIGDSAFQGCELLNNITILSTSITSIGADAFNGLSSTVTISGNIPNNLFTGVTNISSVTIGNNITSIGISAFQGCSQLTSIIIPNNVATIGDFAFQECSKITSVSLGSSITSIGASAFQGCELLNNITILSTSITSIGADAFNGLSSTVTIYGNIPNNLFYGVTNITNVTIGNTVSNIGTSAFQECSGIAIVTIGSNVTTIGNSAFQECSKITSISLGSSITSIGDSAFQGCELLNNITILSTSITSIGADAFNGLSSTVTISGNIPNNLFTGVTNITNVTIGNNVTSIGISAFQGCSQLTSIIIPNNVATIGNFAFQECSKITSVSLGSSITSIGASAFQGCELLNNITILSTSITSIGADAFNGLSSTVTIYGNIPNNLFYGVTNITNVTIGNTVSNIGTSAFQECSGIAIVTIGSNVTTIGNSAFQGCSQLSSVTIPNNVTIIGNSAFQSCSQLSSMNIPNNVATIGDFAFEGCSKITLIRLGSSLTSIGFSAFQDCELLNNITILSTSITFIGVDAFYGLPPTITISGNIPATMFNNITSLITVYLASNITNIAAYTFQNCSGLTNIYLPNISSIEPYAFDGCGPLNIYTSPSNTYIIDNMSKFPTDSILLYSEYTPMIIPTEISQNKITGTAPPNSIIVITEKSIENREITYQIQTNEQGIWYFNITVPSNTYSFRILSVNNSTISLQNNFLSKYQDTAYQLTTGVPVTIKPRIYALNSFDARWWRISPSLPAGLKLSQATGIISGTPLVAMTTTKYKITSNSQIYTSSVMEITLEIV